MFRRLLSRTAPAQGVATPAPTTASPAKAALATGSSACAIDGPAELDKTAMAYFGTNDRSQELILKAVRRLHPFASVVDFGTGRGRWLKAATAMGATDVRGYDLPQSYVAAPELPEGWFIPADLGQSLDLGRRFDLAISTEVAEHLPKEHAATFVANIAKAADLVLFSAAIPYQGGNGHQNENWLEYWVRLFRPHGFACYDVLRMPLWNEAAIRSYYRQNLLIFARGAAVAKLAEAGLQPDLMPPSLVHPEMFLKAVGRALPPPLQTVGADVRHYYDCVTREPADIDADPARRTYGGTGVGWGAIHKFLGLPQ